MVNRICRWCGEDFATDEPAALFCKHSHKQKQKLWRAAQRQKNIERCPHPEKVSYSTRGLAIVGAGQHGADFYLCRCGVYHLTTKKRSKAKEVTRLNA